MKIIFHTLFLHDQYLSSTFVRANQTKNRLNQIKMQKGRKISWWVLRRVMVLHSFSCDCAKITVFVSTSFFSRTIFVFGCNLQYWHKIKNCSINNNDDTTKDNTREWREEDALSFSLENGTMMLLMTCKEKRHEFEVEVFTNIQICKPFHHQTTYVIIVCIHNFNNYA